MPRPKIYADHWLLFHPYKTANTGDKFYTNIADKVHECIVESDVFELFKHQYDIVDSVAVRLTMYLEDLASNIGVWRTVIAEFKERYGYTLPFYELSNQYDEDLVNVEDIRFLLWNEVQSYDDSNTFINPLRADIEDVANKLFDIFEEAWDDAPANERLYRHIHDKTVIESYDKTKDLILWFHYNSFTSTNSFYDLGDIYDEIQEYTDGDERMVAHSLEDAFRHKHNMLSICVPKWLGRIRNNGEERKIWENIKWQRVSYYEYQKDKDQKGRICLKELVLNEYFWVENSSFEHAVLHNEFKDKYIVFCSLVSFKDTWNQCGMITIKEHDDAVQAKIDLRKIKLELSENTNQLIGHLIKRKGRNRIMFLKNKKELMDACKKIGSSGLEEFFKDVKPDDNCLLICSPTNGIAKTYNYAEAVCADNNPLYNKDFAKEKAIDLYTQKKLIRYREICDLHDANMLPDARINTSKGEEHDTQFVRKYGNYIIDYFFEGTRKYDYDEKRWYVTYGIKTGIM